jgi:cation transport ATPase
MQREEERSLVTRLRVGLMLGIPLLLLAHGEMAAGSGRMPFSSFTIALLQLVLATPIQFYVGSRFYPDDRHEHAGCAGNDGCLRL